MASGEPVAHDWQLLHQAYDPAHAGRDATLFALANGHLGIRGAIEELPGEHMSLLPGAYVTRPLQYHESFPGFAMTTDTRLAGPGVTAIRVRLDGVVTDFTGAVPEVFCRSLDPREGVLRRRTLWRLDAGRMLLVASERIVPFGKAALCAQRIAITPIGFDTEVAIEFLVETAQDAQHDGDDPRINARAAMHRIGAPSQQDPCHIARFAPPGSAAPVVVVADTASPPPARLKAGETLTVERYSALAVEDESERGADRAPPLRQTIAMAAATGFDRLVAAQGETLAAFWSGAAIAIDGDTALEAAIAFNLFQLFQNASRDPRHSIAAKGLTGEGYEGHYFWDTDVFVAPVLALLAPDLCRHVVQYRIGALDQARAHARAIGHRRGALYPWRTISGAECSAHYPTGSAQYHVNAGIAYALEIYGLASGKDDLLHAGGAEMLFETARLWMDCGAYSSRRGGAFVIHGVTGPDEYSALVDNDFYTNAMARRHLHFAVRVARRLAGEAPDLMAELARRIGFAVGEAEAWQQAADAMWLPLDAKEGVHPQDDSFLDKPLFDADQLAALPRPLLLQVHPLILFRHRIAKQGDVLQAMCTAEPGYAQTQMQRDLDYYEPLTSHDSTLSSTAFATVAARCGRDRMALDFHRQAAFVDLEDRHGNSGHGAHLASLAGSWLTLAQGWAGMTLSDGLGFAPHVPKGWHGINLRLRWRGRIVELSADREHSHYALLDGAELEVRHRGEPRALTPAGWVSDDRVRAVIFDLDGVLTDTAEAHFHAWQQLCREEDLHFDRALNERLKGVDRAGSLGIILEHNGRTLPSVEFAAWMARKNGYYREAIAHFSRADLFAGAEALLASCNRAGLRVGLASASRNAPELITRLGIADRFDAIGDPDRVANSKPAPDIFLAVADMLGVPPHQCVGIEDAVAGISAINAAGMTAIGIGDAATLQDAARTVLHISKLDLHFIYSAVRSAKTAASIQPQAVKIEA